MRQKTRILSIVLSLVLLLGLFPVSMAAETPEAPPATAQGDGDAATTTTGEEPADAASAASAEEAEPEEGAASGEGVAPAAASAQVPLAASARVAAAAPTAAAPAALGAEGEEEPVYAPEALVTPFIETWSADVEVDNPYVNAVEYADRWAQRFLGLWDNANLSFWVEETDWVGLGGSIVQAGFVSDDGRHFPVEIYGSGVWEDLKPLAGSGEGTAESPLSRTRSSSVSVHVGNLGSLLGQEGFALGHYRPYIIGASGQEVRMSQMYYLYEGATGPRLSHDYEGYFQLDNSLRLYNSEWKYTRYEEQWEDLQVFHAEDTVTLDVQNCLPPMDPGMEHGWYGGLEVHLVPADARPDGGEAYWENRHWLNYDGYRVGGDAQLTVEGIHLVEVFDQVESGQYRLELLYPGPDGHPVASLTRPFVLLKMAELVISPQRTDYTVGDQLDRYDFYVDGWFGDDYSIVPLELGRGYVLEDSTTQGYVDEGFLWGGTQTVSLHGQDRYGDLWAQYDVEVEDPLFDMSVFPDERLREALQYLLCANGEDEVTLGAVLRADSLDLSYWGITDVTGLSAFPNLTWLNLDGNELTELTIADLPELEFLSVKNNQLTMLDVFQSNSYSNAALHRLDCSGNQLTEIRNLRAARYLEVLDCADNQLKSLDLYNGEYLLNIDCSNNSLTYLDLRYIERAVDLTCRGNQLTGLDPTKAKNLYFLDCSDNDLTGLNLAGLKNLVDLNVSGNQLTALDVSTNTALCGIVASNNRLTGLDLTANTALEVLRVQGNYMPDESALIGLNRENIPEGDYEFEPQHVAIPTTPGAPAMTSRGTRSITLAWEPSTDPAGIASYEVYRDGEHILTVTEASATDTGLEPGAAHSYTVVAENNRGLKSETSEAATLETATLVLSDTAIISGSCWVETVGGLRAAVLVNKQPGYDPAHAEVYLEYRLAGGAWQQFAMPLEATYGNGYHHVGQWNPSSLAAGDYEVRYRAVDAEGTEAATEPTALTLLTDTTPPAVTIPHIAADTVFGAKDSVNVYVEANDELATSRIDLDYSTNGGLTFTSIGSLGPVDYVTRRLSNTFAFDHSALPDGFVVLRATAFDRAGNTSVTTRRIVFDKTSPATPGGFSIRATDQYIFLDWTLAEVPSDFRHFNIWRSEAPDGGFEIIKSGRELGYYDDATAGLAQGVTYYYYVTSEDIRGNVSAATDILSAKLVEDAVAPVLHAFAPAAGSRLQKSVEIVVSATDNYRLDKLLIEYRPDGGAWTEIATLPAGEGVKSKIFRYSWDCSALAAGSYELRYTVYDGAGNAPAVRQASYTLAAYTAPAAPALTAQAGHKAITLSWSYGGDADLLYCYKLYRADSAEGPWRHIGSYGTSTTAHTDAVANGVTYLYKVEAVDRYGAVAASEVISLAAVASDDEAPVAVIGPEDLIAAAGQPFTLTGAASTDNDAIAAYAWDFGDGSTGEGAMASHTWAAAGDYTVTLTVTDDSGNTGEASATVRVLDVTSGETGYTLATFRAVDASREDTPAIAGATVLARAADGTEFTAATGGDGAAALLLPDGSYTVSVTKSGYLPRTFALEATGGAVDRLVGLSTVSLVTGELDVTEMTYEEIIEAGIDVNDPDNQHVSKIEVEFEFTVNEETTITLPVAYYQNEAGTFIPPRDGGYTHEYVGAGVLGTGEGAGATHIAVYPISERFFLVVYGEARWLKEMYNVELIVMNGSYTDSIQDVTASLALPEGLSLAAMVDRVQTADIPLGDIGVKGSGTETARANWYVRGDAAGEYLLSATVSGTNLPNGDPFTQTFTATKPMKVYAGDALELNIYADPVAYRGENYKALFELKNTSDKDLYNLSFGLKGASQFQVRTVAGFPSGVQWTHEDFGDNVTASVGTLAPGGSILIEFATPIWFRSIHDLGPVRADYLLKNVFVTTLEGSTTEIPTHIHIGTASLASVYEVTEDTVETGVSIIDHAAAYTADLETGDTRTYRIKSFTANAIPSQVTVRAENGSFFGPGGAIELTADTSHYTVNGDDSITISGDALLTVRAAKSGSAKMIITYNDGDTYTVDYTVAGAEPVATEVALTLDGEAAPEAMDVPVPLSGSKTLSFAGALTDQFGNPMDAALEWTHGTLPEGVTVSGGEVTVTSEAQNGSFTLTATDPASGLSATITLTLGALAVAWDEVDALFEGAAFTYGDANGKLPLPEAGTATAIGSHSGSFAYVDGEAVQNAGQATITVAFTVDADDDLYGGAVFERAYTLTIAPRPIELTVQPASRGYGEENPAFAAALTGGSLAGSDTLEDLGLDYNCGAGTTSPAGLPVAITATLANANYDATLLPGELTILPAGYSYAGPQASWLLPKGSGLSALTAPAAGSGVNGEAVAGTLGWYTDPACTNPATDGTIASLPAGGSITLYWRFAATDTNYTTEAQTGAVSVTIEASVTLVSLRVSRLPTKQSYNSGETLNLSGMTVTATYSDGTSRAVTGYTTSPAAGAKLEGSGTKTVTVSYTEGGATATAQFNVTVKTSVIQQIVNVVVNVVKTVISWIRSWF